MSIVCLYFPRHICNCYSKNALWFLLPCQTALWYWLHVKNNLPVLLVQNNLIFQLLLYAFFYWKREAYLSLFWFDCANTIVIKVDTDFEICLWTLSLPSDLIVITFVFSLSLEWHFICNLLDLFHLHLHNRKAASLLINTEHCVCNHCHGHEKKNYLSILAVSPIRVNLWFLALFSVFVWLTLIRVHFTGVLGCVPAFSIVIETDRP